MKILQYTCLIAVGLLVATLTTGCSTKSTPEVVPVVEEVVTENQVPEDAEALEPEIEATPEASEEDLTQTEQAVLNQRFGLLFDLESHETAEVELFFSYFNHKARKTVVRWLERSQPYLPYVRRVFTQYGLPQDLVLLPFVESGYNVKAYSWAGAGGMWQFMKGTGRLYGLQSNWWIDERRDPYKATDAAARHLRDLYDKFGDWYLALAAYNAGEGKISRALKQADCDDFFELTEKNRKLSGRTRLKKETRHYVPKFIAISKIFQNLDSLGYEPVSWEMEEEIAPVKVPAGTDLLALARAGGMTWSEFHEYNPAFRRQVSPPNMEATAYLPVAKADKMIAYLADPGSRPYAGYTRYRVRSGDSWWRISSRYGVPINVLKSVNNTRSNTLRPGQYVMVPGNGAGKTVTASAPASSSSSSKAETRAIAAKRGNYVVHSGDTLWSISQVFGTTVSTLKKANGLRSNSLKVGQKLYIPNSTNEATKQAVKDAEKVKTQLVQYKVRRGDNLTTISEKFGVTVSDLRRWNSLNSRGTIYAGQKLKVYVQ
ncbi:MULTISPECIES: lytic transglycosylase domain-containing protein [unclassified Pseudodesulfovibrio]|uniref:lytic transglycosylase domain-containing protein n=1 Tax=Pseudodesulfovibrio sp. S3 TaxID=2283629 RepID=UPI000FEB8CBD|nr:MULTISPECIES: lytic transglycosylase domain-containing protein [unclassified Pseudodesulfovibrio]MCJ2165974.1 LysM peptidoglycan-binding domain-containing protein [Pseudodesulfovibrio sp. S3-i]RWU02588.1 LysM peptidoglycan-binding domain-containing protein [Pseudodesulfovibrio sp. S3]